MVLLDAPSLGWSTGVVSVFRNWSSAVNDISPRIVPAYSGWLRLEVLWWQEMACAQRPSVHDSMCTFQADGSHVQAQGKLWENGHESHQVRGAIK